MPETFTAQQILRAALRIAKARPETRNPPLGVLFDGNEPCCLFGRACAALGMDAFTAYGAAYTSETITDLAGYADGDETEYGPATTRPRRWSTVARVIEKELARMEDGHV